MNNGRLNGIIKAYKLLKERKEDRLLADCANSMSISAVIKMAATARGKDGKRHSHQHRLSDELLFSFYEALQGQSSRIKKAQSFDALLSIVESLALKGIGDLAVYDTAHRIGAFLNLYPNKVYLHRGTRTGAENLLGKIHAPYLLMEHLPAPLQGSGLSPAEIEDLFCIYKERLKERE